MSICLLSGNKRNRRSISINEMSIRVKANMINSITTSLRGYLHFRGGSGHLAFVMHRVSGIGTLIFLSMHILVESTAHFAPNLYNQLNAGLHHPIALVFEIGLAFLVIFHGVNGYRIAYFDLFHVEKWSPPSAPQAFRFTWIISFFLWLPVLIIMLIRNNDVIVEAFLFFAESNLLQ